MPTVFSDTIAESLRTHPTLADATATTVSDTITVSSAILRWVYGLTNSDTIRLHPASSIDYQAGAAINELLRLSLTQAQTAKYGVVVNQVLHLDLLIHLARELELTDGITIHASNTAAVALRLIDRLLLHDALGPTTHFGQVLLDTIGIDPVLERFIGREISDGVILSGSLAPLWQFAALLSETTGFTPSLNGILLFNLGITDDFRLTDAEVLNMIYAGDPLVDGFNITAAYVEPNGGFTTWAINTRTGAVTEYKNYSFNSMTRMGHQYLGARWDGLWLMNGELDDTENIMADIRSGDMQLGGSHFTAFKAIYLGLRVKDDARDFILKLHAGDGREYVYSLKPQNMMTTKVTLGKGHRSRYFAWELITPGPAFDLESIEFIPLISQRRV